MSQSERKEAILDNIGLQEGDSVFVIGCETGEIIDWSAVKSVDTGYSAICIHFKSDVTREEYSSPGT
jgi:cyclopropane fatty-acyl-phospholipid synthase-like methyltransferase